MYNNECFGSPFGAIADTGADEGSAVDGGIVAFGDWDAPDRLYRYGPTREIEVRVYQGKGVNVTYGPTTRTASWEWDAREMAFAWANERGQHMRMAGYRR